MFKRLGLTVAKTISPYVVGIPMVISAIFISLALTTYDRTDPSFNRASSQEVHNMSGEYGAFIADPLLQSLGFSSILPILFLAVVGIKILSRSKVNLLPLRFATMLLTTLAFSCLLASISGTSAFTSHGGYIGAYLKNELILRFDDVIIFWSTFAITFIGSILALNLTIRELFIFSKFCFRKTRFLTKVCFLILKLFYNAIHSLFAKISGRHIEETIIIERDLPNITPISTKPSVEIVNKAPKISEARAHVQSTLKLDPNDFEMPSTTLFKTLPEKNKNIVLNEAALSQNSKLLQKVLEDFGIKGEMLKIHPGPVVTLYEFEPAAGVKSSRVIGLADDLSRSMSAVSARIAVIPGKSSLGIELPNTHRETVYLREMLETKAYQSAEDQLPLILGKNIFGEAIIADLAKMPHLLVAGTTGSGKSVAINTMILSLLYRYSPKQCKFIMIDPKMLELSIYDSIPHLLAPVVTDPKKAISALRWVVKEMENRYKVMSILGVRNVESYNKTLAEAMKAGKKFEKQVQVGFHAETGEPKYEKVELNSEPLPFIVVIVDEMADLMLTAGKEIEASIQRLAQMARAAGIHLIMATQRPSVDVVTGIIKANFPTRISFQVTSKIDSRTILGEQGAEQLLGMGDMLFMRGGGRIERVHGPFVDDREVESVTSFLKAQGKPSYIETITQLDDEDADAAGMLDLDGGADGDLYNQAVQIVLRDQKASTSYIQRCLRIGYNRAANLIEKMEKEGIVGPANHVGKRDILLGDNN